MRTIDDLPDMMDRIHEHYKNRAKSIESSREGDGEDYIFKMLYKALNLNSQSVSCTRTVPNESVKQEVQRQVHLIDDSTACIIAALCELLDQEYENRIDNLEDSEAFYRHEADEWRDISTGQWDNFESGGF